MACRGWLASETQSACQFRNANHPMSIALHPRHMSASERLNEVAEILSTGAMRLIDRKSRSLSANSGDSSLDFTAHQSVHAPENKQRIFRK
ncbi:hypothetical protein amb1199 [Paramagnetospirillum magneticum AMB-1]|uniref:Uncharacterized protein n=2 Tax=Paramagnetospirillum magneticum TaxID=84159 RepID=Q2W822_PARM1|nr:hypothetical protein amb1199 [Paramagnetospirillum magneticum AMB-1]